MNDTQKLPKTLLRAQRLANLTDTKMRIPIVNIPVGLDFLVGLIPVVGDFIMVGISLRIVAMAKTLGVPKNLRLTMVKNIAIDFLLGIIPFVGDVADLFYKSNQKNVAIMEKWWRKQYMKDNI